MTFATRLALATLIFTTAATFFAPQASAASTCAEQQEVNTQVRLVGDQEWRTGDNLSATRPTTGTRIDVNCFAKTGFAQLEGGVIEIRRPDGSTTKINRPELFNFELVQSGTYRFTCSSTTIAQCSNSDSVTVVTGNSAPTPRPTPTPAPHSSTCENLKVVGGDNSTVPAKVTLRASGNDSRGNLQGYRYFFGDGERIETTNSEVTHEYKSSGSFLAKVEIKDSQGNYKSSNSCEARVRVKPSSIESHKYGCSDFFVSANNGAKAPSTVNFTITGYDNRRDITKYKIDFGNGIVKESDSGKFEQVYNTPGTYLTKAYIRNANDQWVGGSDECQRTITIGSKSPLTSQPSTGTPTILLSLGIGSGVSGLALEIIRRRLAV